jgi:hypothetical protein
MEPASTRALTEFSTTCVCGVNKAREDRTTAYGHSLVGTIVVRIIKVGSQLDHDRVLHDLQSAAVTMASALSEKGHVLSIGILDLVSLSVFAEGSTSGHSAYRGNNVILCGRLDDCGEGRSIPGRCLLLAKALSSFGLLLTPSSTLIGKFTITLSVNSCLAGELRSKITPDISSEQRVVLGKCSSECKIDCKASGKSSGRQHDSETVV